MCVCVSTLHARPICLPNIKASATDIIRAQKLHKISFHGIPGVSSLTFMIHALVYWEGAVNFPWKTCLCRWYSVTQTLPHSRFPLLPHTVYAHFSLFFWSSAKCHWKKWIFRYTADSRNLSAPLVLISDYLQINISWLFLTDMILLVSQVFCKVTLSFELLLKVFSYYSFFTISGLLVTWELRKFCQNCNCVSLAVALQE